MSDLQERTVIRGAPTAQLPIARIELDNGISFSIEEANLPVTIGRATECDICIPSGHVSRHHCQLYMVNGVLCLKDTSSNGTVIDDRVVKQGSVSIQGPTTVSFAGEVRIQILPTTGRGAVREERRHRNERRQGDRRASERREGDRRHSNIIVNFERRTQDDRRTSERRN